MQRYQKTAHVLGGNGPSLRGRGTLLRLRCIRHDDGTVHPRVGGEHIAVSMPHRRSRIRFIPAWAGNTEWTVVCRHELAPSTVHPRVGGEHRTQRHTSSCYVLRFIPAWAGNTTSTLTRQYPVDQRFIPAWAGNTRPSERRSADLDQPVHPRVGGEHASLTCPENPVAGSSPRGRGTRKAARCPGRVQRFIPAWAGNTALAAAPQALAPLAGSSPRGRGTQGRCEGRPCSSDTVHPRVGGEHTPSIPDRERAQ